MSSSQGSLPGFEGFDSELEIDKPKSARTKPRNVRLAPVDIDFESVGSAPAPRVPAPVYAPTRRVDRFLCEPCAAKLRKIMAGSPKLSPAVIIQSAVARGEWLERTLEDGGSYRTVEIVPNEEYKHSDLTKTMCRFCAWRHICNVDPSHIACDYETDI